MTGFKDALDKQSGLLDTLRFLKPGYKPKAISVAPESNPGRPSEIIVLGIQVSSNKAKSETRNSKSGAIVNAMQF